eukprot:PITA_21742
MLARQLDQLLIKESLMDKFELIRQWVGSRGILDHLPVYLEITSICPKPRAPFKFNSTWLRYEDYHHIVIETWQEGSLIKGRSVVEYFAGNLLRLKKRTIEWAKKKKKKDEESLKNIEAELARLEESHRGGFVSAEAKSHVVQLESEILEILKEREETWRLKCKAIWLQARDKNTKKIQQYAKQIIKVANLSLRFVDEESAEDLNKSVTLGELEAVLKWFRKDKSPGPNGWPMEFCLAFFDLIGQDLLRAIEDCQMNGRMHDVFNATFIALIPNLDKPSTLNDFRPISLCNCISKIIAKIITNRIKPILSQHISQEQFAFLDNRQIHEAIGIAQEGLHSLKIKNLKGMIFKIDLSKAYDKTSWLYLQMLLTHLGFPRDFIKWIVCCISSVP